MNHHPPHQHYPELFIGLDVQTPTLNGGMKRYINFDNAASTPALKDVGDAVNQFLIYYSSVHRGTGFKSQLSTHIYERTRQIMLDFVGANPDSHTCIFGKNTTEALNKLARRFPFNARRDIILTSGMEHHSNDLPWRGASRVVHVGLTPDGRLDEDDYDAKLAAYGDQVALVAITGASNVTGYINPYHRLAEKAHAVGAQFALDAAQLAPHRRVDMKSLEDPGHLDYVAISAHKMYAPFGTGVLIGRLDTFQNGNPDQVGGGTVSIVTLEDVLWADAPERDEAGSPNVIGAVALAASLRRLTEIGMEEVARHEAELTYHLLTRLPDVPGIEIYGDSLAKNASQRLGVVPFNIKGLSHFLVAAILGNEFGIGVRNGCFCAHPYLLHLLGLSREKANKVRSQIVSGDRSDMPGMVRISFGLYNTIDEIDKLIEALKTIAAGDYKGKYQQETATGEFHPVGWQPVFNRHFRL
jgi:selenocysteine lyase/cysteine desulfurase